MGGVPQAGHPVRARPVAASPVARVASLVARRYDLSLEYDVLVKAVDLGPSAAAATDDTARGQVLTAATDRLRRYLADRVVVWLDGASCEPVLRESAVGRRDHTPYAELKLAFACPGSSGAFRLRYTVFAEEEAVADEHTNLVAYRFGDRAGRTVFDREHHEVTVGNTTAVGSGLRFARMGVEHILGGLDHVLFVVALILGASTARGLTTVVSMFTVAHSVTLLSTLLGGVAVPAAVVEPLIALSIAFVAVENVLGATRHRLPVVLGFGLLHGLGFAGSLRITDELSWDLVVSLLSFKLGIEGGQALLLLAVFPLVLVTRRSRLSVPVVRTASGVVACSASSGS